MTLALLPAQSKLGESQIAGDRDDGAGRAGAARGAKVMSTVTPAPLHVTLLTGYREIADLAGRWRELESRAGTPILFQSAAWCLHLLRTAEAAGRHLEAQVYAVYQGPQLVAVLPLKRERQLGLAVLTDLSDPYGQYADIVVDRRIDVTTVMDTILAKIRETAAADALLLRKVRADAALSAWMLARGAKPGPSEQAPAVTFAAGDTIEALRAHLRVKRRKNMRNGRNRLSRIGELGHHVFSGGDAARQALARSLAMRLELMDQQGVTSRAFRDGLVPDFVAGLTDAVAGDLEMLVMVLRAGAQDVAIQWGFVHNRRYYAYVAARNSEFDEVSPGTLHLEDVLATCLAEGVQTADFLAPALAYKQVWANHLVDVRNLSLCLTTKGRALDLWQGRLRPLARGAFLALPDRLRRPLARLLRTRT